MRRRGTPEGRRLFGACVGTGLVVGLVVAVGMAIAFRNNHDVVLCNPENPRDFATCNQLELAGFLLTSSTNAALTIGPIVAFLVFLVAMFVVLYSHNHFRRHD